MRSKNVTNILIKNFADLCFGGLSFFLCGFGFAFGAGSPFIGYENFLLIGYDYYAFFFFQVCSLSPLDMSLNSRYNSAPSPRPVPPLCLAPSRSAATSMGVCTAVSTTTLHIQCYYINVVNM